MYTHMAIVTEETPHVLGGRRVFSVLTCAWFYDVEGGDVDIDDMGYVLKAMGITLTDKEHKALLAQLPISGKHFKILM